MGFFSGSTLDKSKPPVSIVPKCGQCGLYKSCNSPKMPVAGQGKKKILIVGEGPGETEDKEGKPFVGRSGQELQATLSKYGVEMFRDCWVTNSVICRTDESNRTPTKNEINYCRPNVINTIKKYKPEVMIVLGNAAVQSVIGWLWKDDPDGIARWAGFQIPNQMLNCWICPTYHPAYVLREDANRSVIPMFFNKHIKAACKLRGRPWEMLPNYKSQVVVEIDPAKAAQLIRKITRIGKPTAFDFETNMLKPEWPDAKIISCSLSNGGLTIAYPWHGEAIDATIEFLKSDTPKIASNMKYEHRWSWQKLGVRVRRWQRDTMVSAHVIDNRRHITSLKFQVFTRLGYESYNDHIERYLRSKGNKRTNQALREIALHDLLLYNGLDSLFEWHLANLQEKDFENAQRWLTKTNVSSQSDN